MELYSHVPDWPARRVFSGLGAGILHLLLRQSLSSTQLFPLPTKKITFYWYVHFQTTTFMLDHCIYRKSNLHFIYNARLEGAFLASLTHIISQANEVYSCYPTGCLTEETACGLAHCIQNTYLISLQLAFGLSCQNLIR